MTETNQRVLQCIQDFIALNGYPPTLSEIAFRLHIRSKSTINFHLEALEAEGYITRRPFTARGIRINGQQTTPTP